MSLTLLQTYTAIANNPGLTVPFGASGGTPPYVFSIVPGGAGGSIIGSTGLYSAPGMVGVDVVRVTDSTTPTALVSQGSLAILTPLQLVADVIKTAMNLQNTQVYLYDQKYDIPTDNKLYIAVGVNSLKPFGNRPKYSGSGSALTAVQSVNILASLSIHILSRSTQALFMKEQVLLALSSPYAEQQMNLNSFYIAPVTTGIVDLSEIDGAAIPYHFNFSVNLQYVSVLQTMPAYFSTFPTAEVTTDVSPIVVIPPVPGPFTILVAEAE